MKASDYIAAFLAENGVKHVFEMCGGMTTHLLDSLYRDGRVEIVSVHHEQAAAFAAEGSARMSGTVGVAMATSGPGATNLLTGIASCYFDSVPAVFITGQVNRNERCGEHDKRQGGFQETDIVSMARPVTLDAWSVDDPMDLPASLERAFALATSMRPGPVLLDIPMDVQRAELPYATVSVPSRQSSRLSPAQGLVDEVCKTLLAAKRPLVLAGGGIRTAGAHDALRAFAHEASIPVISSLMGIDALPYDDMLRVGMIGTYGNRWANLALGECDTLLVLGSRLDVRQTGADPHALLDGRTVIQVDVDEAELGARIRPQVQVHSDVGQFLEELRRVQPDWPCRTDWLDRIHALRERFPDEREIETPGINPALVMHAVSGILEHAAAVAVDVGQNQMWAAQSLRLRAGQRFLTSGGMGAMGFALPAAIGASLTTDRPIVCIAGDGGFQVNVQELEVVARLGLPLRIIVMDNGCLGMVRQFQAELFESRFQSTVWGYGRPDFSALAQAFGIPSLSISEPDEVSSAMLWLDSQQGPALLHVHLDPKIAVSPKVQFGRPVFDMEPPPWQ